MTILILLLVASQDLLERDDQRPLRTSPGRLDLRIGPNVDRTGGLAPKRVGFSLDFAPDIGCGGFDLGASFKSMFNKNLKEELLGGIISQARSQLAGSAMVLACQMSPTVCDAIKHYRVTAQEFLDTQLGMCQSIEQLAGGTDRQVRASAVKECLERKQAEGATLDDAMKQCKDARDLRGLRGQRVQEIDLAREIEDALGLTGESGDLLGQYVNGVKMSTRKIAGDVKVRASDEQYEKKRKEYAKALTEAAEAAQKGVVPPKILERLSLPGVPPLTNEEVQRLTAMDPVDRDLVIGMLSASMALSQVVREAGDVRAMLESARAMATEQAVQESIDREARRIDEEVRRLKEAFEMDSIVTQARLRADAATVAGTVDRAHRNTADWRGRDQQATNEKATREWGKACPTKK